MVLRISGQKMSAAMDNSDMCVYYPWLHVLQEIRIIREKIWIATSDVLLCAILTTIAIRGIESNR